MLRCALVAVIWYATALATQAQGIFDKQVPATQVIPLPYDQASFQYLGRELTRYHFGQGLKRPFFFPVIGPAGCSYTRMGHPHDPVGHSHHNSIWISHADVDGYDFWSDRGTGQIVLTRISQYEDREDAAVMISENEWRTREGTRLLQERRRIEVRPHQDGQWWLLVDIRFVPVEDKTVVFNKTAFGLIGVRVAKTIGVRDGGGRILNSQGGINERETFRKPARWVDYSGPITKQRSGGILLLDHPKNEGFPHPFHVRDDGWMGICLSLSHPVAVTKQEPLRVRYGLWIHDAVLTVEQAERSWRQFAEWPVPNL